MNGTRLGGRTIGLGLGLLVAVSDEGCVRREPYPIILEEGWNHVRVIVPYQPRRWGFIFSPVLGSSERPREVLGLRYRSSRP